jgi:hypothetical protein
MELKGSPPKLLNTTFDNSSKIKGHKDHKVIGICYEYRTLWCIHKLKVKIWGNKCKEKN